METPRPLGSYYILGPNENIMCVNSTVVLTRAVQRRVSGLRCIVVLLLHRQKFPEETWVDRFCMLITAIIDFGVCFSPFWVKVVIILLMDSVLAFILKVQSM